VNHPAGRPGRLALGFLYPGYAAEDDYPRMAAMAGSGWLLGMTMWKASLPAPQPATSA